MREEYDPYFGSEPIIIRFINGKEFYKLTISFHHEFVYYNYEVGTFKVDVIDEFELDCWLEHDLLEHNTKKVIVNGKKKGI